MKFPENAPLFFSFEETISFSKSLGDPIIKILLVALAIKTVFLFQDFDWFETLGIMIAIFLSTK